VRERILALAIEMPELSPRKLAVRFTDTEKYFVSEASVYRLLKAHDLIASPAFLVVKVSHVAPSPVVLGPSPLGLGPMAPQWRPHHWQLRATLTNDAFRDKTTAPNQLWQTDFTYLKIIGWGWFYLSTILDEYSRFIIAWKLCNTMHAEDVTDTLALYRGTVVRQPTTVAMRRFGAPVGRRFQACAALP
jgi:putative transposase